MVTSEEVGFRWRFRGGTPSPERFVEQLWRQVFAQFVVVAKASVDPLGLVQGYGAELRSRYAYLSVAFQPSAMRRGWPLEGVVVFLDYLFLNFGLRKVYIETLEFNLDQFRSALGAYMVQEGRLRDHDEYLGQYVDLHMLAIYREPWLSREGPFERIGQAVGQSPGADGDADLDEAASSGRVPMPASEGGPEERFLSAFADEFGLDRSTLDVSQKLATDLHFDSLDLLRLSGLLEMLLPGFELPEQMAVEDVAIQDVCYYYALAVERSP